MKNLHKRQWVNIAIIAGTVILAVCSIAIPAILNNSGFELWYNNETILSVICMGVFLLSATLLFSKNSKTIAVTMAMLHSEKNLKTDRISFPSKRINISITQLKNDFLKNGYVILDESSTGFLATKKSPANINIQVANAQESQQILKLIKSGADNETSHKLAMNIYIPCFLGTNFDDNTIIHNSKDVIAIPGGCILPIYYDTQLNQAYYMGGYTGKRTCESLAQKIIKEIILLHPEPFMPKTEADITEDEREFNTFDIEKILRDISHPLTEELAIADGLQEGELKLIEDGTSGCAYYKYHGKTIAHTYKHTQTGYEIASLSIVYYCAPKAKPAPNDAILHFKEKIEAYCKEYSYPCSFN